MSYRRIILTLLIFLTVAGCKAGQALYKLSVTPDPGGPYQTDSSGKAVTFEEGGIWGAIVPLSFEALSIPSEIDSRWDFADPFKGLYPRYKEPIPFYLIIENRSHETITLNPSASFSLTLEGWPLFLIEYDDLYQSLYDLPGGADRLERMKQMFFRSYLTLKPGEHVRGLLLFKRPEPGKRSAKKLFFRIRRIYAGKQELSFLIPFRLTMEKALLPPPGSP
jgi:hypothetical protein